MKENGVAKTLQIIGWLEAIAGFIISITVDTEEIFGTDFGFAIISGAFITCMIFQGFAEIIDLLQQNSNKQTQILELLKDHATKEPTAPKTIIEDIESNLPQL